VVWSLTTHTGIDIGRAHPPYEPIQVTQNSAKMHTKIPKYFEEKAQPHPESFS